MIHQGINYTRMTCIYYRELLEGIPVYDADGNRVGESKKAAEKAIALVLFSRICMAAPGMCKCITF